MTPGTVHIQRLTTVRREAVASAILELVDRAAVPATKVGKLALVKINAMSDEVFPGRNTSPWVLDGVLAALRLRYPQARLLIVDTDVAGSRQFDRACRQWGYYRIAERHGVEIVNLSHEPVEQVVTGNERIPSLEMPQLVREADSIINVPVLKTHVLSGISVALKNHWGLLPRVRYQFHPIISEVIAELNRQIPHTALTLVDATVCMEGAGPKTGQPRVVDALLASTDRVAMDSAIVHLIGMPAEMAPHIRRAEELGVGTTQFVLAGDPLPPMRFALPIQRNDLVSLLEARIRGLPVVGKLSYHPRIATGLGLIGTQFNKQVWMRLVGHRRLVSLMANEGYRAEFDSSA